MGCDRRPTRSDRDNARASSYRAPLPAEAAASTGIVERGAFVLKDYPDMLKRAHALIGFAAYCCPPSEPR